MSPTGSECLPPKPSFRVTIENLYPILPSVASAMAYWQVESTEIPMRVVSQPIMQQIFPLPPVAAPKSGYPARLSPAIRFACTLSHDVQYSNVTVGMVRLQFFSEKVELV